MFQKVKCLGCEKQVYKRPNFTGYCLSCKNVRFFTGKKLNKEHKEKISKSKIGDKNSNWAGDSVGLGGLHVWVRKRIAKPQICPKCNERPAFDLANSGVYDRNLNNWKWLCRKCHMDEDGRNTKLQSTENRVKSLITLSTKKLPKKTRDECLKYWRVYNKTRRIKNGKARVESN